MQDILDENISHKTCMTSVTIRERVNRHQPMMKSNSHLLRRLILRLYPYRYIIVHVLEIYRNLIPGHTDVFIRLSKLSCLSPDITKHSLVQLPDKLVIENILWFSLVNPG